MTTARHRRINVTLPPESIEAIDALADARGRSQFVANAVEEAIGRRRLREAIAEMDGALAGVEIPGWETPEAGAAWVRALRDGRDVPVASPSAA